MNIFHLQRHTRQEWFQFMMSLSYEEWGKYAASLLTSDVQVSGSAVEQQLGVKCTLCDQFFENRSDMRHHRTTTHNYEDAAISYCKQNKRVENGSYMGSINISNILTGKCLAKLRGTSDNNCKIQNALEDVTALFYDDVCKKYFPLS